MEILKEKSRTRYLTFQQAVKEGLYPNLAGLRWLRFNSETNGYYTAFKKIGGRILIDRNEFFRIVEEQNQMK